jgi:hypothetical protein
MPMYVNRLQHPWQLHDAVRPWQMIQQEVVGLLLNFQLKMILFIGNQAHPLQKGDTKSFNAGLFQYFPMADYTGQKLITF